MKKILYWLAFVVPLYGGPALSITTSPSRTVTVSWPNEEGTTYRLLRSSSVTFASFLVVTNLITTSATAQVIISATSREMYYKVEEWKNPLHGMTLYVDQNSQAANQVRILEGSDPAKATLLNKIAREPQAFWLTHNNGIRDVVSRISTAARQANALPIFSAYFIPKRDCNSYSGGGARTSEEYLQWCTNIWSGIGSHKAVTLLEPDGLALISAGCLTTTEETTRYDLIRQAGQILRREGRSAVYLDGGHSRWHSAGEMATRLRRAGVLDVDGFFLNVSNFRTDAELIQYGTELSRLLNDVHFIIDTSRNGLGPNTDPNISPSWCNPPGRALGRRPTTNTDHPLIDAFLWVKRPGESDGDCRPGEPRAGVLWLDYALGLAERAAY